MNRPDEAPVRTIIWVIIALVTTVAFAGALMFRAFAEIAVTRPLTLGEVALALWALVSVDICALLCGLAAIYLGFKRSKGYRVHGIVFGLTAIAICFLYLRAAGWPPGPGEAAYAYFGLAAGIMGLIGVSAALLKLHFESTNTQQR